MSAKQERLINDLVSTMKGATAGKTKPYDTPASVTNVDKENGIAYVHIPGGVDETPAQLTINAKAGDDVQVRVENGRAFIIGNKTTPPTGDAEALRAKNAADLAQAQASNAITSAQNASVAAANAEESAQAASDAAEQAVSAVDALEGRVDSADARLTTVEGDITQLESDVDAAEGNITNLQGRVSAAEGDITTVEGDITNLQGRVSDAEEDVDGTLKGLALAQNVVGTLAWITAHSTVTTDQTPQAGTTYYIKHQDGTFELVTDTTGKNPAQEGWYVLDEALQNYVMMHLALTNDGLLITADGETGTSAWKLLISNNGIYIKDRSGNTIAQYGSSVIIKDSGSTEDYSFIQLLNNAVAFGRKFGGTTYTHNQIAGNGFGTNVYARRSVADQEYLRYLVSTRITDHGFVVSRDRDEFPNESSRTYSEVAVLGDAYFMLRGEDDNRNPTGPVIVMQSGNDGDGFFMKDAESDELLFDVTDGLSESDNGPVVSIRYALRSDGTGLIDSRLYAALNAAGYLADADIYNAGIVVDKALSAKMIEDLQNKADSSAVPTKTSELTNDSGFLTAPILKVGSTGSGLYVRRSILIKDNISVTANSYTDNNDITPSTTTSGYTIAGIVGVQVSNASSSGTGGAFAVVSQWGLSTTANKVSFRVKNVSANAIKVKVNMDVLYVKD